MGNVVPTGESKGRVLSSGSAYAFQQQLCNGKFLKSMKCRWNEDGAMVVVKVYARSTENLKPFEEELEWIRSQFSPYLHPNILPYQKFYYETDTAVLVRQYICNNLYDRMSTHPFLSVTEKLWIAFQLLEALSQCHNNGICHGDVKAENVMVTSWNWVILTDFAPYKPTYILSDQPAQYNYFFATTQRSCCTLAPERFCSAEQFKTRQGAVRKKSSLRLLEAMMDEANKADVVDKSLLESYGRSRGTPTSSLKQPKKRGHQPLLKASMDIFSAGCVIAELFMDGEACFDLSELLKYSTNQTQTPHLAKVLRTLQPLGVDKLVENMVGWNAEQRLSAEDYLKEFTGPGRLFPSYFPYLFDFMKQMLFKVSADDRIWAVCANYAKLMEEVADGYRDQIGSSFLRNRFERWQGNTSDDFVEEEEEQYTEQQQNEEAKEDDISSEELLALTTEFLRNLEQLQGESQSSQTDLDLLVLDGKKMLERQREAVNWKQPVSKELPPVDIDAAKWAQEHSCEGVVMLVSLVCSTIRFVRHSSTKVTALWLLSMLSQLTDDETRLQRIVPFIVTMLLDSSTMVRCTALKVLTRMLEAIKSFPPSDSKVFQEYLLPALKGLLVFPCTQTQLTFYQCMPRLAESSRRFLEISHLMQMTESKAKITDTISLNYDAELTRLRQDFERLLGQIVTRQPIVKRSLLQDITRLCLFFGHEETSSHVLKILITFLNERDDWQLRATFFKTIPGVSAFVGPLGLEKFLLPCIEQALQDNEERVVEKVLGCLTALLKLGLLHAVKLVELVGKVLPLVYHPCVWVRNNVIVFLTALLRCPQLTYTDIHIRVMPILRQYLSDASLKTCLLLGDKSTHNLHDLLERFLKPSLTRKAFETALYKNKHKSSSTWLKLSTPDDRKKPKRQDDNKEKLIALRPYLNAGQPSPAQQTINSELLSVEACCVVVPHQANVFLFLGGKRAELTVSSGDGFKKMNPSIGILQAKYGIQALSSKHTGNADEAMRGGVRRLQRRIRSLRVPKLPPDMGSLRLPSGAPFSLYTQNNNTVQTTTQTAGARHVLPQYSAAQSNNTQYNTTQRKGRIKGVLCASLCEHKSSVNRVAVAQDNLFFATASADGTCRIWLSSLLSRRSFPRSSLTYASQSGRIVDCCVVNNTHSIVSASDAGSVHVVRVEHAYQVTKSVSERRVMLSEGEEEEHSNTTTRSVASSTVVEIDKFKEGAVRCVSHFDTSTQSLVVFATERGTIHGWDLRSAREAFTFRLGPQAGLITSMVVAPQGDCVWLAIGTSRGVLALWDLRYNILVKAWRHSKGARIHRLYVNKAHSGSSLVYAAAGRNEFCLWDVAAGACVHKYKAIRLGASHTKALSCPKLYEVPISSLVPNRSTSTARKSGFDTLWDGLGLKEMSSQHGHSEPSVRALLCSGDWDRTLPTTSQSILSAGSDSHIRFWDLNATRTHSYTVSGIGHGQLNARWDKKTRREDPELEADAVLICEEQNSKSNTKPDDRGVNYSAFGERHGPVPASSAHDDCILDLGILKQQNEDSLMLLSCSRDGVVKAWR